MEYTNLTLENYPDFLRLYNQAFPAEERRPYTDAQHLDSFIKMKGGKFHGIALKDGDLFVGFLTYWTFEKYIYIEHFAITPEKRGRNIGRTLIEQLIKTVGENILLEVERPDTEEAQRRIKFYERLGFRARLDLDYVQPPYAKGLPEVPMILMTHGNVDLKDWRKDLAPMLREVYNVNHDVQ